MKKKRIEMRENIGCLLDGSCNSAEDIDLRIIEFARAYGAKLGRLPSQRAEDYGQILSELADSAVDYLNDHNVIPFTAFEIEDNSLFFSPLVESAREDCEFVSVKSLEDARRMGIETDPENSDYPPAEYRGLWLHVNDHGNATLYERGADGKDVEIWAVV